MSADETAPRPAPACEPGGRAQIGGIAGVPADPLALARLARSLGARARLLDPSGPRFAGEWDSCFLGDEAVENEERWRLLLEQGRLGDVEGAFALAWIDGDGALHLARDGIGERSLFYGRLGAGLAFASTLRPLLEAGLFPRTLNASALPAYLSFGYVPGRETLVEGVFELLPGEHLVLRAGRMEHGRLWSLPPEDVPPASADAYRRSLRRRLERAVARRLPRGEAVAATLSGGIDSSLVVALARQIHDGPVLTYSLSFGRHLPNELAYSSAVAAHCGTEHRVLELSPHAAVERFDETLAALSTPIGEPLTVSNALLFDAAASEAAVVLNGEGGDPCFGGPKNVPMILHEIYGPAGTRGPADMHRERAYLLAHRKCFADLDRMLEPDVAAAARERLEAAVAPHLADRRWSSLVNRLMALNVTFKGAHHILGKVDHLSRAYGVVPRSPLFDRGVAELALRMPAEIKLEGAVEKAVLKQAVADLLPAEVVARRKSGMRVPVEAWLEGHFERFARERLLGGLAPRGLVRRSYLEELVCGDPRPPRRGAKIWLLLSLEAWLRGVLADPGR